MFQFVYLVDGKEEERETRERGKGEDEGKGEGNQVIPSIGEDADQWEQLINCWWQCTLI